MNYIWEVLLKADEEGVEREAMRFVPAPDPSPYMEVSFEDLNADRVESGEVEVNPLYRFWDLYASVSSVNVEGMEKIRELFVDISLHYLAQLDLRSGRDRQDYYIKFLVADIRQGLFGKQAEEAEKLFSEPEKRIWQIHLLHLYRNGEYRKEFGQVVRKLYGPMSILWTQKVESFMLLFLIPHPPFAVVLNN